MIKPVGRFLFSMQLMGILTIVFFIAIAYATFIENDFGTAAARAVVYNALWFEVIMALLILNFLGNIKRYKLVDVKKLSVFLFHVAFIVILLGAFITRYIGEEGYMRIREGKTVNTILSAENYLAVEIKSGGGSVSDVDKAMFSPLSEKSYKKRLSINGDNYKISSKSFVPNAVQVLRPFPGGTPFIELIIPGSKGRESVVLQKDGSATVGGKTFFFGDTSSTGKSDIHIYDKNFELYLVSNTPLHITDKNAMADSLLEAGKEHRFTKLTLYKLDKQMFVLRNYFPAAKLIVESQGKGENSSNLEAVTFEVAKNGGVVKELTVMGEANAIGNPQVLVWDADSIKISYGAARIGLPFSIRLNDFILDRYPGSNSPSSFMSKVVLIDHDKGINEARDIFMNNVLKHRGYRFYQASYDSDEQGTVLSVNKDLLGTFVTYLGYLLLTLGMFLTLFNKHSRFIGLAKTIRRLSALFLLFILPSSEIMAQDRDEGFNMKNVVVNKEHAASFGEMLIQDNQGRIKPINTLSSQILRKVARKSSFNGLTADQVFLGMASDPAYWQNIPMIKVSHSEIRELLGMKGNLISFKDIAIGGKTNSYILAPYVEKAYRKKPAYRTKFDNEVLRVDERVNICYVVYMNTLLRLFPLPNDSGDKWYTPADTLTIIDKGDTIPISHLMTVYYAELEKSLQSGDWTMPNEYLEQLKKYQNKFGEQIIPQKGKQKIELIYNKYNIFDRISNYYGLFGFIILILNFIALMSARLKVNLVNKIGLVVISLLFVIHGVGLGFRWYIAGYAPWSNGYEALVFIAWGVVLVGLLFYRMANITVSLTASLAFLILHVAHLSWMDPEITTLVPVLKSVWLIIHVAIITTSYAFLALGALLALVNLLLMIFKTSKTYQRIDVHIHKLSSIAEMTIIAGLFMLTVGTFLGGVWANESWGRYWGWDPKETWALATILIYTLIVHFRLIPWFKGLYAFNLGALISFGSVIMTYFGVNYYLAGLHSYAKGDPLPIPNFVLYTIISLAIIAIIAYINNKILTKKYFDMT